jgi:hypothetical protein
VANFRFSPESSPSPGAIFSIDNGSNRPEAELTITATNGKIAHSCKNHAQLAPARLIAESLRPL